MAAPDENDGKMAGEAQSFFLVPASSGQCVEERLGELYTNDLNGQEQQRWRLEYDSEDSNNVAFKNVLSEAFLCFSNGIMGARVMIRSGTSQYFRLETSDIPGALRIQSVDYPKTYLCNSHGYWSVNNQAIAWVREPHLTRTTLWYIVDHDVWKAQKDQLYRPDSAISIHDSSRHDPATARGRSDVQHELQSTEFHDDTLPDPNPPSTAPQKEHAEKEQPLGAKETIPMEGKEQLAERETSMPGLLEAKGRTQEGRPGAKPLENAALNMPKPERIVTEPESLRMKMLVEHGSDQKASIPPPAQMDSREVGIGARKLEDVQIRAPDANLPSSLDPRSDGIGAPIPSLPRSLELPFERAFGFFDLGGRDRERPALRPIVMPTGFSHLKRL